MRRLFILPLHLLILFAYTAGAEDRIMDGGESPDAHYEIRIEREGHNVMTNSYGIHLCRTKPFAHLFTLPEIGGYLNYSDAVDRDRSYWHSSSHFVAITDQGTRHSRELYILAITYGKVSVLTQPDFKQNALGRVNATEADFIDIVTVKRWNNDDLTLTYSFTTPPNRDKYTFEIIITLFHEEHAMPRLALKSIKRIGYEF